ncbi:hypothetical protein RJ639_011754 [Escallonia herrerae]|uniref:beta-galactosidase n=1 Tax=Escallonia herrerae TaxID=1293975 RepID=A0AA88VNL5_9ASTE|nr:hypothetical protein RJ639_011754 [Escallonia herrerae]
MAGSLMEVLLVFGLALLCSGASGVPTQVSYDSNAFIINGERRVLFSGAIHYPRSTPGMWPDLIRKAKEGGLDMIETYIFWDRHEPKRGEVNTDLARYARGFPVWLHNLPGIKLRTDNEVYKNEMQKFITKIVNMCKEAKLFGPQGGPIILAQIENEYGNVMGPYGEAGKSYIKWCAELAVSLNVGVPWVMCKQADAPEPMINTCNGFYCNTFKPNNPKNPKMLTENWVGWFVRWGGRKPHRPAEDLALSVALFFQSGGIFMNYYMYHGGTNFGRTAGGPYIATSYEYDAPLDEYGNLNQPKWGHLKQLHAAIKSVEKILTNSTSTTKEFGNANLTTYTNAATGERVCFLSNLNTTQDAHIDLQKDGKYFVPAWSVSILEGCNKEIYNSAKISTQETVMVKKPDGAENRLAKLSWQWTAEPLEDRLDGRGDFTKPKLLEQTATTLDASDYLWYMTSVNITDKAWTNAILRVNTTGHVLHAFVNGKLVGYKWADVGGIFNFTFEKNVTLNPGINRITLLSAAVGLKACINYGAFYDTNTTGIVGGPVELVGKENATIDLSSNLWSYKVNV